MGARLEQGQRRVASGKKVVASDAGVGGMASCADCSVESGVLPVDDITPPSCVGSGPHRLVTVGALRFRASGSGHIRVAHVAFRVLRRSMILMIEAEAFRVEQRLDRSGVTGRDRSALRVDVAGFAV